MDSWATGLFSCHRDQGLKVENPTSESDSGLHIHHLNLSNDRFVLLPFKMHFMYFCLLNGSWHQLCQRCKMYTSFEWVVWISKLWHGWQWTCVPAQTKFCFFLCRCCLAYFMKSNCSKWPMMCLDRVIGQLSGQFSSSRSGAVGTGGSHWFSTASIALLLLTHFWRDRCIFEQGRIFLCRILLHQRSSHIELRQLEVELSQQFLWAFFCHFFECERGCLLNSASLHR